MVKIPIEAKNDDFLRALLCVSGKQLAEKVTNEILAMSLKKYVFDY